MNCFNRLHENIFGGGGIDNDIILSQNVQFCHKFYICIFDVFVCINDIYVKTVTE